METMLQKLETTAQKTEFADQRNSRRSNQEAEIQRLTNKTKRCHSNGDEAPKTTSEKTDFADQSRSKKTN